MIAIQPETTFQHELKITRLIVSKFEEILRLYDIEMDEKRRDKLGQSEDDQLKYLADRLMKTSREEVRFIREIFREWKRWSEGLKALESMWAEHRGLIIDLEGHDDS